MKDVLRIHLAICEDHRLHPPVIQLSLDGIQESKSSSISLDVFSVKFNHCRNIYPISITRPCDKFKYDEQEHLKNVLKDIKDNNITIECAVFDNPKRSMGRCAKSACSKFPCEYCEQCAVTFVVKNKKNYSIIEKRFEIQERQIAHEISQLEENLENPDEDDDYMNLTQTLNDLTQEKHSELQKSSRKQLTWPASTMNGNLRTLDGIKNISEEIESNPEILKSNPDHCKGIKGKSLFLEHPRFNIIRDLPCEYMHLVCLGAVKRLTELTFKVGENRERTTKRKLSDPNTFNDQIKSIQLTRECSRRCRNLDFGVMKAAEFRNMILFFFPIIIDCIDDEFPEEKKLWLHLTFMIRGCVISNNEFRNVNEEQVKSASCKFYKLYEKVYGQRNCTYSIHVVGSHILKVRGNRPLTYKSAFKFENFFAELKNMFHAGTVSSVKQILSNCFVKRMLESHHCEKSTFFCPEKKPVPGKKINPGKENNHLIYTLNEDYAYEMYVIKEIVDYDTFKCHIQGKFPLKLQLTPEYKWSDVGVFKVGPISEEIVTIKRNDICGKVIKVKGYLITCPLNVLHEQ